MTQLTKDEQVTERQSPGINIHKMKNGHTQPLPSHLTVLCRSCCSQANRPPERTVRCYQTARIQLLRQHYQKGGTSVKTTTPLWSNKERQRERTDREMEHTETDIVGIDTDERVGAHYMNM